VGGDAVPEEPPRHGRRRRRRAVARLVAALVRIALVTSALMALYASAPITGAPDGELILRLGGLLLVLCATLAWQIRAVTRSGYPGLRAAEAVAVSVPALVLGFAFAYVRMANADPAAFSEGLTRIDAAYFATTVFSTVGFGDIAPRSETARLAVTLQMVVNLVVVGVIVRVLFGAVQNRRRVLEGGAR
jgi:voltage-gated potassium channel